jgi:hypothetical protein
LSGLRGTESSLLDPRHEIVSVRRLVELVCVGVRRDTDVRVSGDLRHPDRVEVQPEDQVADERPA